uniref:Aminotransferase class I/classII large domain-containing protein n=1 Tax=Meloidogyne enterolobii TaxID=390850 RepID=A0A6V7TX27_MELEN|nr:unnamed protein product [Meloidogyne enterolobii]
MTTLLITPTLNSTNQFATNFALYLLKSGRFTNGNRQLFALVSPKDGTKITKSLEPYLEGGQLNILFGSTNSQKIVKRVVEVNEIRSVFVIINEESIAEEDLAFLWPGFPLYARLCRPNGIESRQYRLEMDDKGLIDLAHLESLIDSQIRAIIVNNPLNPTGVTFESCGSEIVVGSEVRTKSTPICSFGSIAVNFSQGIPMIGVLYEDAWTLNETCRFRVFGSANAYDNYNGEIVCEQIEGNRNIFHVAVQNAYSKTNADQADLDATDSRLSTASQKSDTVEADAVKTRYERKWQEMISSAPTTRAKAHQQQQLLNELTSEISK